MSSALVGPSAQQPQPHFAWPAFLAAMSPSQRNFRLALAASIVFHSVLLSIHFRLPQALLRGTENALDVVLVNSKHAQKPNRAQVYAQNNLDAGGNSDQEQRATTLLPPTVSARDGNDLIETHKRVKQLEAEQKQILAQLNSKATVNAGRKKDKLQPPTLDPAALSGLDLANRALAVARLEAQIDRQINDYNKRPRIKSIGIRAEEYRFARYVEDWRQKIERIGNLNYPEAAKGRWYGSLMLTAIIKSDGELQDVEINRSSGVPLLDEAAKRIVRMSAPYAAFPEDIRRDTDIITITRKWSFTHDDLLQAQ